MKGWKRTLAALLAAIMLVMPFGATAELALEPDALPEVDGGVELEIAPEAVGDGTDVELELPNALALDGLDIEDIDLDAVTIEDAIVDGAEAEAANSVQVNDDDSDFVVDEDGTLIVYLGYDENVIIPDGITGIGEYAFGYNYDYMSYAEFERRSNTIKNVRIPDSVTWIGTGSFHCKSLKSINIPDSVTSIGELAFSYCESFERITIPYRVKTIGAEAFSHCTNLKNITLSEGINSIEEHAFQYCTNLLSIEIPESVNSIGEYAFSNCSSLQSVTILGKIEKIDEYVFYGCSDLEKVIFPETISIIGRSSFGRCEKLTHISIPESVEYIDWFAFEDCTGLKDVYILGKDITIESGNFDSITDSLTFHTLCETSPTVWARSKGYNVITSEHTAVIDPPVAPTYTEPGKTEGSHCSICGKVLTEQETVPKISMTEQRISIEVGKSDTLQITSQGKQAVIWSSDDSSIASVTNGTVMAISEGICTIYATFDDGHSLTCEVTVTDSARLSNNTLTLKVGNTFSLSVERVSGRTVTWSSSDATVSTVKDGTITAIGEGTCTITATLSNGKALKCALTVKDPAALSKAELSMNAGSTYTLKVYNLGNRTVTWFSSDTSVATVKAGTVTAIKAGSCTITATLSNDKALKCALTIKDAASLSETKLSLNVGKTYKLKVNNLGNRTVTWSSSDNKIATVKAGTVTAIKAGSCTITATLSNGKTLQCALTVKDPAALSKTELSMNVGSTYTLKVYSLANRTVTWSSSNKNVATVQDGKVTATGGGKCTITAKVKDGKTLECAVSVTDRAELYQYDSESEDYDWYYDYSSKSEYYEKECTPIKSASLDIGETLRLVVIYTAGRTVVWSSSNTKVATVNNGKVTPTGGGKCTITAKVGSKSLTCNLTVTDSAKLSETNLSMNIGDTHKLAIDKLAGRTVTWSSSDATVATVKDGTVTAIKAGKCTITAQISNGKALKCALTVKDPATLSKTELSMNVGSTYTLKVYSLANRTVTWSSSNKNVATVQDGKVTATGGGKCTITAKVKNGKTLECAVSVTDRAELYRYDSESEDYDWYYDYSSKSEYYEKKCKPIKSATLDISETLRLVVIYTAGRTVIWSSSNTKVATVNNGKVTPTGGGKCTITAKIGSKSLTCYLTVTDSAKLSETNLSMNIGDTHKLAIDKLAGRKVTWTSSNKNVATVKDGTVTAVKAGKCTITARVTNGKTFKCNVTVKDAAKLNRTKLSIKAGDSQKLEISGLNNRRVTWRSSNKKVATVKDGKITAVNIGKCTVTAQIKNGKKLSCKVTVTDPAALSEDKLTLSCVDSARIKLTGALKRKVTWSTSNSDVVKITNSNNGSASIKAVKNGTATITAKIEGGKTLKCVVKVVDPLTITVDEIDEESVYNELWVYFNNHSNKKITYVTLDIAQYNNRGEKLQSPYDYYYLNETVAPHDSLHHYYWVNDDTKKVRIKITEVTFADKTTWKP